MKKRKAERCKSYRRTKKYYITIHSCERYGKLKIISPLGLIFYGKKKGGGINV